MISNAPDVDAYIQEAPAERRGALERLRALGRKHLNGCEEVIDYGMPCYKRDGKLIFSFASHKQYISIYGFGSPLVEDLRSQLLAKAASAGKGCIHFARSEKIDFDLVEQSLVRLSQSASANC